MSGRLIVISGPSGSGKSTIVTRLLERVDADLSISATTRLPRPGERHGVHYLFVSRKDFDRMIGNGELLEWAEYSGRLYGTPLQPVVAATDAGRDILLEIEIQGARQVRESRPDALMFFVVPPSLEELERRLRNRGDTDPDEIEDRMHIAQQEIDEAPSLFDHIVVNESLDQVTEEIERLIKQS